MSLSRRMAIATLGLVAIGGCLPEAGTQPDARRSSTGNPSKTGSDQNQALQRAARWLWSQQADDGGWHSPTYGLLRSGQAYTPLVLFTLLSVPESRVARPGDGVERALDFIRRHTNDEGVLGVHDPDLLEYPNYATSYALRCLAMAGKPEDRALITKMRGYLLSEQYRSDNGFPADHAAHGAWGFGQDRHDGAPGHLDLAHTRRVIDALAETADFGSVAENEEAFARTQDFLGLLQRLAEHNARQPQLGDPGGAAGKIPSDGGFYFSPVVLAANKGRQDSGHEPPYFRSYASATCDGVLALIGAGVDRPDPRVQSALKWLADHPRWDYPEGVPEDHPDPWGEAIRFYHMAVRAETFVLLGGPDGWQDDLRRTLTADQRQDGSFLNTASALMKEDDPLLCTTLALIALTHSQKRG